jgi:flagellar biosynthesis/type III secretory pathway ATPase
MDIRLLAHDTMSAYARSYTDRKKHYLLCMKSITRQASPTKERENSERKVLTENGLTGIVERKIKN